MGVLTASRAAMRADNADKSADQSRSTALSQIATYIPSDVVATYVALQGIFYPGSSNTKWVLFALGLGLCIALPILNWLAVKGAVAAPSTRASLRKQGIIIGMALIAFTAYAMALPGSVFGTVFSSAELWGAASALVLAILLPAIAKAFKVAS